MPLRCGQRSLCPTPAMGFPSIVAVAVKRRLICKKCQTAMSARNCDTSGPHPCLVGASIQIQIAKNLHMLFRFR